MTKEEALTLLATATRNNKPSKVNPALTRAQMVEIIEDGVKCYQDGATLPHLMEKRVWQAVKNQRRPRF